jgi:hypothetical protein
MSNHAPAAVISEKRSRGTFLDFGRGPEAAMRAANRQRSLKSSRKQGASSTEVAMIRRTIVVVAMARVPGSSALSASALARRGGGGRMEGYGCGPIAGDGDCGYGGHISGSRDGFPGRGQRDMWGHWGACYGPMFTFTNDLNRLCPDGKDVAIPSRTRSFPSGPPSKIR